LYTGGTLTLSGTQFISNTSTLWGGGAWANNALFTGGVFQGNRCTSAIADLCLGGGVLVDTRLAATGTRFINNTSSGEGGGAWTWDVLLTGTTFAGNRCTGAGCQGGGLFAEDVALATGSAFTNNQSAGSGGAIDITETAQLTLTNVTLSGNTASVSGGGLYVGTYAGGTSTANLYNVTVAGNQAPSGGGLFVEPGTSANVTNTIIANNGAANCAGLIVAGTHNLEFPGNTCALAGPSAGFTTADPLLAPLALNPPGTTLTQALRPGSPARDHGDPVSCANSLVNNLDQRGAVRPDAVGEACDIGAYEAGPPDWLVFLPLVLK
jgi:predicted outer membrane repeat protein